MTIVEIGDWQLYFDANISGIQIGKQSKSRIGALIGSFNISFKVLRQERSG